MFSMFLTGYFTIWMVIIVKLLFVHSKVAHLLFTLLTALSLENSWGCLLFFASYSFFEIGKWKLYVEEKYKEVNSF